MKHATASLSATITGIVEVEPGYLLGLCIVGGVDHNAEFIRVEYVDGVMELWKPPAGQTNHNADRMAGIQSYFEGAYATVRVPGFEGDYAMHIFPQDIS